MTDFTWPDALAPYGTSFYLQPHTGGTESPFSRQSKIYQLSAPRYICRATVKGGAAGDGLRGKGAAVDGFLARVGGRANRIWIYDYRRPGPSAGFRALTFGGGETFDGGERFEDDLVIGVNAAAEAGATIIRLTGCAPSTLLFRSGDYVGGDGRPHTIAADVRSTGAGDALITFRPPLKQAIAAGGMIFRKVRGPFRLVDDDAAANASQVGELEAFDLQMVEDL